MGAKRKMRRVGVVSVVVWVLELAAAHRPLTPVQTLPVHTHPARPDFPSMLPLMYPPYNYGMPVMPFYQNPWLMHAATGKTPHEVMQLPPPNFAHPTDTPM